jgi:hypothetical protein
LPRWVSHLGSEAVAKDSFLKQLSLLSCGSSAASPVFRLNPPMSGHPPLTFSRASFKELPSAHAIILHISLFTLCLLDTFISRLGYQCLCCKVTKIPTS